MWGILVKFTSLILLTTSGLSLGADCPSRWFDCGNGKCIAEIWLCDGDNDCGNLNDEKNCDNPPSTAACLSSQYECESDKHCIPERWHCDGENDCIDGSDEVSCDNATEECTGYLCRNHQCIPTKWRCDGNEDCIDGSDEERCSPDKLCARSEFLCSTGSCVNGSLVCDGNKDCVDGSDEGQHCGDPCENFTCSQICKSSPTGPLCDCNDGYVLDTKDNKTCIDVDECQQEGFCSHKCINTVGGYRCSCLYGYQLVNRTCRARGPDPLLIFSNLKEIRGIRLRSGQYFLVRRTVSRASAVDVDPKSQRIYWIEISNTSSICSAMSDGNSFRTVLSHGLLVPEDLAVDYIANNLYITDSKLKQVLVCKMDGTMCHVLHATNVEKPRSIVLDPSEGLLYWSDWGDNSSGIYRSGMDGSRRITLVSNQIAWPNGIAIDHSTNRLYWADAKLNTIECITLDGSSRKMILNTSVFHPYSLAVFEDNIYWTDWATFSLESCNKFTGHKMTIIARENGKHIMGVHVYHPVLRAQVSNPCRYNDCSHMCLISPGNRFRCACSHGFKLGADDKTCTMEENVASIFVSEGSSIFYIRPEAVGRETLTELPLNLGTAMITRVSYDSRSRYLFVADLGKPAIYAINMTSLHMRELVRNSITSPEDLAFDWMSNNLYWVDSSKGTVEVISVVNLRRVTLLTGLNGPVALAISPRTGHMFVATVGSRGVAPITMYGMDGKNQRILNSVRGLPMSLALHPSKSILYWTDPRARTISYVDYNTKTGFPLILKSEIDNVMSVAASEEYVYWTSRRREVNLFKENTTHVHALRLPGQEKGVVSRKVTYSLGALATGKSDCLTRNGGCSYLCLTSPNGRACSCSTEMMLSDDNVTCVARECESSDFKCMNGRCLPTELRCDGNKDCDDGSDEVGCSNRCYGDEFQCKNGRCILKSWHCDGRDDCGDNSDEEDCPALAACTKDQISCSNGECVPVIWRCDGEADCTDSSDEINCNATRCNMANHIRCDTGQCVPISWVCDGANDCYDGSDEKNCSKKAKTCSNHEFRCVSEERCIDEVLKCDGRVDCRDASDETNCTHSLTPCESGMKQCNDGTCLYVHEFCDGHNDCSHNEDELNCTHTLCQPQELLCPTSKRCILRQWICDGDEDCSDGTDEMNCTVPRTHPQTLSPVVIDSCDEFYCYVTSECLPWSKVCDGRQDCEDLPDEGGLCSKSCSGNNGGCSHICKKSPHGSKCLCNKGFELLPDNKTCGDIDECLKPGICSHFCNNTEGGFKCSCAEGYRLHIDRRLCKAEGGSATLIYLLGDQIRGFDLLHHTQKVFIKMKIADMKGMDYDASQSVFYWTESNDGSINSYSQKTLRQDIIRSSFSRPVAVRYDWIAKNLYYRDESSSIGVCTTDGKFCKTLIQSSTMSIDSMDISPLSGLMFWTIWANPYLDQHSGIIERAEMDGSHRLVIVSDKTNVPTAITVDHVLKMIYWSDRNLNTLERADFHGFMRKQIVKSGMYHPLAVALFEDHVYWSDWGTDSIIRCDKFTGKECEKIHEGNVKTNILLIAHEVMQPNGTNRCLNSNCQNLCLLTRSGHTCVCDDSPENNGTCLPLSETVSPKSTLPTANPKSVLECPKEYCRENAECVVESGEYVCKCSPPYSGERCEVETLSSKTGYSWVVAVLFSVVLIGVILLLILLCIRNRDKLHKVSASVTVKFRSPKSGHDGRLVMDTDDGSSCEEFVLGQEGEYKQCKGNSEYMLADAEEGDFKKWPPHGRDSQKISHSIVNYFQNLKSSIM